MDIAYDHIQEEALSPEAEAAKKSSTSSQQNPSNQPNLNTEFRDAYKSFSASPWGTKLGGFLTDFKKSSGTFIDEAKAEATDMRGEAFKGFTDLKDSLVGRARSLSAGQGGASEPGTPRAETSSGDGLKERNDGEGEEAGKEKARTESEALRESEGVISRFRTEAAKRLKDLEKAEEAADAAIFRFGANIGNFLKEAVTIAPPSDEDLLAAKDGRDGGTGRKMRFESKDQDGKRVFHSTRFEAQLHAVHSSPESFLRDPLDSGEEFGKWREGFDVEKKTEDIRGDLERYEELRGAMERLVPEKVEYKTFWTRYYFLRMVVETKEQERRDVLKGAAQSPDEEPIGWDDDSDDDDNDEQASTPQQIPAHPIQMNTAPATEASTSSSTTINPNESTPTSHLKPAEPRRSQDLHSQPDSDASYDLVSGATSRAPGSPKEVRKKEEDEEEDWE